MMRPALRPLHDAALASFTKLAEQDTDATVLPNLLQVVQEVCTFVAQLGLSMIQAYVDVRVAQSKARRRTCRRCASPMQWHAHTQWRHGTQFGDVHVRDVYAYCRTCGCSARPLHGWLGTGVERWSLTLQEKVVDLASDESCEKAVQKLARQHGGVQVGRTTALRMLHAHGAHAVEFVREKLASAVQGAAHEGLPTQGVPELEVEYDCGMIPVATLEPIPTPEGQQPERTPVRGLPKRRKNCRWEEAKLGLVQVPGQVEGRLYTVRPTGQLDASFEDLFAIACMSGWTEQTQVRGIADGARYIRPRMAEAFHGGPFRFILDRPHAQEHLGQAAAELVLLGYCQDKDVWAKTALDRLERGEAAHVVAELRRVAVTHQHERLRLEADYFERNQDAVDYHDYRARGWSTASSEVESGHRSVVQVRLKLSGTWWHPDNVENILALRMIKANHWWDQYWQQQRQRWKEQALDYRDSQSRTRLVLAA